MARIWTAGVRLLFLGGSQPSTWLLSFLVFSGSPCIPQVIVTFSGSANGPPSFHVSPRLRRCVGPAGRQAAAGLPSGRGGPGGGAAAAGGDRDAVPGAFASDGGGGGGGVGRPGWGGGEVGRGGGGGGSRSLCGASVYSAAAIRNGDRLFWFQNDPLGDPQGSCPPEPQSKPG